MSSFNAIWSGLLLLQLTLAIVKAQSFPAVMTLVIQNDDETIVLNWKRTEGFLANENLPIWLAERHKIPRLNENLMGEIGPFACYHDVEKSSAVILFNHQQLIFGIIDTRFIISELPLSEVDPNIRHVIGGHYVRRRDDKDFHDNFPEFLIDPLNPYNTVHHQETHKQADLPNARSLLPNSFNEQQAVDKPEQVGDPLYAEVLVFISNNVVKRFAKCYLDLRELVTYYLIYFNGIDMMFAKLHPELKIFINIAGLVIELEFMVFPYVFIPGNKEFSRVLDGDKTLEQFPEYIEQYNNVFPRDSFDFFFLSTHYRILDEGQFHYGLSVTVNNYVNRKSPNAQFQASGVLVERQSIYSDFVTSAHEIAHQLHVEHDPANLGKSCRGDQCFAIMQVSDSYCRNCIRWSEQSINEFKAFASSNLDHCFLLNVPRSLYPHGTILRTLGPDEQCKCYKYAAHWQGSGLENVVNPRGCNVMLLCTYQDRLMSYPIPKPIDGTPCGLNEVCWKRECQPLSNPIT